MFNPVATYRIQFNKDFTFEKFERLIPYYQQLGVSTIYASPIFAAVPGSTHGYDVTDPHRLNPEIGTLAQLRVISGKLKQAGINWLQDIVPNHMAFHPDNKWLMDVLEKGSLSAYAAFFDMAGTSGLFAGNIMVPFLGNALDDVLKKDKLTVTYRNGELFFTYYDSSYPLKLSAYAEVLASSAKPDQAIRQLVQQFNAVTAIADPDALAKASDELKLQLLSLAKDAAAEKQLNDALASINQDKPRLKQLLDKQHYRLCGWQETDTHINFRRFFTVNGLLCLNMQQPEVFSRYHEFIHFLVQEDLVQGLRVDHIDGLYDPAGYLQNLRELVGKETYIVAEKILEEGETLPIAWPIQGTTGYDYLAQVNNLFTNKSSGKKFDKLYEKIAGKQEPVHKQIHVKKAYILQQHMGGELDNLTRYFYQLDMLPAQQLHRIDRDRLKAAIAAFLVNCPVYRFYGNKLPFSATEATAIGRLFEGLYKSEPELSMEIAVLQEVFTGPPADNDAARLTFYRRCMQFTGPLMAKGVEDTLMYTYNRFAAHNEVGDAPDAFGLSRAQFHKLMIDRQQQWPLAMNGTSTHDTKRGEDVRARLNVLTDLAKEWRSLVKHWRKANAPFKTNGAPDANDEYLIYQTIAGSYPMPGESTADYDVRLHQYLEKALREAKTHTQWTEPNETYEQAAKKFVSALLNKASVFWQGFQPFYQKITDFGILNSLAQVTLKFTSPGLPDVYQGCERWDLSLVDPDNRRPVAYDFNQQLLDELADTDQKRVGKQLWAARHDGKIKLWLVQKLFNIRSEHAELFEKGTYVPLQVKGQYKEHILAFARCYASTWLITIVPLHLAELVTGTHGEDIDWGNTRIVLPKPLPQHYQNLLTGTSGLTDSKFSIKEVLNDFPVGVLKFVHPVNPRGSGILMHITSLPSPFGIGDLGPQANRFADFLANSRQKYWQILPLNPTEASAVNSPYSSFSSVAGNTLLISPELLLDEGLLEAEQVLAAVTPVTERADFEKAAAIRVSLFAIAWTNFKENGSLPAHQAFADYCRAEAGWLDDFALYVVLKEQHDGRPWYHWQPAYKQRDTDALNAFTAKHAAEIQKEKWLQYVFKKQWLRLKQYCFQNTIQLIGDLPFYISYDSVDVWANRELFDLDAEGNMQGVAGVPPDYFNADGQLWGMPVFRWDKLKATGYDWWVQRIRKNLELFDRIRLDHFRAFSAYWHVPAGEETAINGSWRPGPGEDLFNALTEQLHNLPFIAEDLGDIDEPVHSLRAQFGFPGMRVLQFAFGDDVANSPYSPHNYQVNSVAYTGTHDNNTTVGWFVHDADNKTAKQLQRYSGIAVSQDNVHEVLHRLLLSSVANIVIVPLQDILGLDEQARMNVPASTENNWAWRLTDVATAERYAKQLRKQMELYNRV